MVLPQVAKRMLGLEGKQMKEHDTVRGSSDKRLVDMYGGMRAVIRVCTFGMQANDLRHTFPDWVPT